MIALRNHARHEPLSPAEIAAAFRNGLESRRQIPAVLTPADLPPPPEGDPISPLWPLTGLLGHPAGAARPGLSGKAVKWVRRVIKKLINPWLDHQTRFNHQLTGTLQTQFAEVFHHIRLLNWRLNEVTREHPPRMHALEGRLNECFFQLSQIHQNEDVRIADEIDAVWAAEETFLQTRIPDPPGRALVLTECGIAPPTLSAIGFTVLTSSPADGADLSMKDGSLRLVVALDRDASNARLVWSPEGRPVREAIARMLSCNGRVIGSLRNATSMDDSGVARLCAPLRLLEVSRIGGTAVWVATL